jgi:hypothetical protein
MFPIPRVSPDLPQRWTITLTKPHRALAETSRQFLAGKPR